MTKNIVGVAVPRRVWNSYDYSVPDGMTMPSIGSRVRVPLGAGRLVGVVIEHKTHSDHKLLDVLKVVDEKPLLSPDLIEIAKWLASYYHHPLGAVFQTMLPHNARVGHPADSRPEQKWELCVTESQINIRGNAKKQLHAVDLLRKHGVIQESQLRQLRLSRNTLDALTKKGIVTQSDSIRELRIRPSSLVLSEEQVQAVQAVKDSLGQYETFLLDGVTGSGKTEVYLQVVEEVLKRGQQVLILLPEIGLTPQMTERFTERFSHIGVLHSLITNSNRFRIWVEAMNGTLPIVVGTRSAVFTPFKNLGLIVVDEEHDASFKQTESLRYSARDLVIMRANMLGIPCILGSATPSLDTFHNAEINRYRYFRLSNRPGTAELPSMHIQDIRQLPMRGGLCEPIVRRIGEHLNNNNQVLVLINRRGHSTQCFCSECGWIAGCTDCETKLTWHHIPRDFLQCHTCGRKYVSVDICPACGEKSIVMLGHGTQQVEEILKSLFPDTSHLRVDRDAFRTNRQLGALYDELRTSHSGLLVGTQMLAKGHHLPNVTLVVVVGADNGFRSNDLRGSERTAQLIVQVAGRAGRAEKRGEVWIQSYDPENEDLVALIKDGYEGFVHTELSIRKEASLPPFGHMALIRTESADARAAESFCQKVLDGAKGEQVEVLGPVDGVVARVSRKFRFQGILLSHTRKPLHQALRNIERMKPGTTKVSWSIDVDPIDMY